MKKTILILALVGCKSEQTEKIITQAPPVIVGHVLDLTKSTAGLTYFDSNAAKRLYYQIATNSGTVKLIRVTDNSAKQDVYTMSVAKLDTQATEGVQNVYQKARISASNRKMVEKFDVQAQEAISKYIAATLAQELSSYTDLASAFSLAKICLEQPTYSGHRKYLLVCSDMENDPKEKRRAPLEPIDIPNTTILFVRPTLSIERLKALFPKSKVYVFADVNDAILSIK